MIQSPKSLDISDLIVGDIIFFLNYANEGIHLGIYAGEKNGFPYITHGVSKPYDSIMTTRLKADAYPYRVLRCKDFNLAAQASLRMQSWVKSGMPFSYAKTDTLLMKIQDKKEMAHPITGGIAQAEFAQSEFNNIFYRYIDMAAHPQFPFMVNDHQNEGVRCSEAVVMAYNIETLLMVDAVHSCKELGLAWVSDKTEMTEKELNLHFKPKDSYKRYHQRRNNPKEYGEFGTIPENGIRDGYFPPSIAAWNYDKYPDIDEFVAHYPFALRQDSKIATSHGLLTYMLHHNDVWMDMGELTIQEKPFPLENIEKNKQEWKDYVVKLFDNRKETVNAFKIRSSSFSKNVYDPNTSDSKYSPFLPSRLKRSISMESIFESSPESHSQANHVVLEAEKALSQRASIHASPKKKIHPINHFALNEELGKTKAKRKLF